MEPEPVCKEDPRCRDAEGPRDRGPAQGCRPRLREEGDEGFRRVFKGRLPGRRAPGQGAGPLLPGRRCPGPGGRERTRPDTVRTAFQPPPLPDRRARPGDDDRYRRRRSRRQPGSPHQFPPDDDVRYRRGTLRRRKTAHHRLRRPRDALLGREDPPGIQRHPLHAEAVALRGGEVRPDCPVLLHERPRA